MRATAFEPPPPTPTTLIRVPTGTSSSSKNFKSSLTAHLPSWGETCLSHIVFADQARHASPFYRLRSRETTDAALPFGFQFQPAGVHRETGRGRPHGRIKL